MTARIGMHSVSDTTTSQYDSFSTWLGQQIYTRTVFGAYDTWAHIASPSFMSATKTWLSKGPNFQEILSIGLCPFTSVSSSGVKLSDVAAGAGDTYWTQLGQNLNNNLGSLHSQVVIRLGWEFNGDWYQWGYGSGNSAWNTITDFKNAWKRVVPLIRANAPNVRFLWCPSSGRNIDPSSSSSDWSVAYPGDSYVDIIGGDFYDSYNSGWSTLLNGGSGVIAGGLSELRSFAQAHNKPEAYPEWSCDRGSNGHGDNPEFIKAMYFWFSQGNVDHHCYWNSWSGGPNAPMQGTDLPIFTGSISGTTLTTGTFTQGSGHLATNHFIVSADPVNHIPILPGTQITGGSGSSWTVNKSQTVDSQTINAIPTPRATQMYKTLFGKQPAVQVIAGHLVGGVLTPVSTPPSHYTSFCDGTNFFYALTP
jgi:hypothetical protein